MLHELLKQATRLQHIELEEAMFAKQIMDGSLTAIQYQQLLLVNYLSHAIFEQHLFEHLPADLKETLGIKDRVKLPALITDVEELDIPLPPIPAELNITPIATTNAAILGAMYVLEGATLGGHVIIKRLPSNPALQPLNLKFHYYHVYGATLIDKWKQFCQVLNTKVNEQDYNEAVKSATDMFQNMQAIAEYVMENVNAEKA